MTKPRPVPTRPTPNPSRTLHRPTDLTGHAAKIAESFSTQVELLESVIGGDHYPSLGQYKERLLMQLLRSFLPSYCAVGTGFVLFPHEAAPASHGFARSKQCDVIVFNAHDYPPVFRDGDFVVVRPESVLVVIEVKGALTLAEVRSALAVMHDFALKWKRTQQFYAAQSRPLSQKPSLNVLSWRHKLNAKGKPVTNAGAIREAIAEFYRSNVDRSDLNGYPTLSHVIGCGSFVISPVSDPTFAPEYRFGWLSEDCCLVHVHKDGSKFRARDHSIASLIGEVQYATDRERYNPCFSAIASKNTNFEDALPESVWYNDGISWAWSDLTKKQRDQVFALRLRPNRNRKTSPTGRAKSPSARPKGTTHDPR